MLVLARTTEASLPAMGLAVLCALEQFDAGPEPLDLILQLVQPVLDGVAARRHQLCRVLVLTG